jgi:hypothetical protein
MDPANRPSPFKRYRRLERQPLATDLDRSSSIVSALPSTKVANPHCRETASRSRGTHRVAASIRLAR